MEQGKPLALLELSKMTIPTKRCEDVWSSSMGIAQFIPGDVLYHICLATEDEQEKDIFHRKHRKNLNILLMMGVCKSWSNQICRLQGLFTDIAFDTRYDTTIFTAAKFLGIVESQSTNLHVYARCRVWIPNRAQEAFLSRLRLHSWRFVCFEVESTKCVPFIAHFNLPAPRLLRLVHTSVVPEGIFSTSFANLRVLDVSVEKYFPWTIPSFRNLVTLRLKNSRPTRRFCSTSLFDLIGRSSCLEEVRLSEFRRFSGSPKRPVIHANVKLVGFFQCNLEFLFQYLQFPSATAFRVESCGVGPTGQSGLPSSGGYFLPLEAHPIPILERYFFTKVTAHTQDLLSGDVHLKIGLECKEGLTADFEIALRKEDSWEDYLHSSINGLLQRIRLDPGVDLSISHHVPLCSTNLPLTHWREEPLSSISTPLLRLSQVVVLRTGCSLLRSVMLRLTDLENTILPNLKCYLLDVKTLPTPEYPALYESVTCLRSRFMNGSPFAIQYLTFEGTDTTSATTVLIERSLPVLVPFLRGTNDGFIGTGGDILGDLYVENSTTEL